MHIVVLPGLDGTGKMLVTFVEALKLKHSVQLITYPNEELLSYDELTELVSTQLPKNSPFVLLAESFSGPIAVKLASQAPEGLKAIIFAASFVKKPTPLPQSLSKVVRLLPLKMPLLYKLAKPFTFGKWASRKLEIELKAAIEAVSRRVLIHRIREIMAINELASYTTLKLPMMYIQPSNDRLVAKSPVRELKEGNSRLEIQTVEGSHFILQTNSEESVRRICNFIETNL